MFKELKNAYKLIQYGLSVKKQILIASIFSLIGIALEIATKGTEPIGAFYFILSGLFLHQMILSSGVSTLIQSSPYKKKIQCTYPYIAVVPWTYVTFTIMVIITWVFSRSADPEKMYLYGKNMVYIGFLLLITMTYFGIVYKYFIAATIGMVLSMTVPVTFVNIISNKNFPLLENFWLCVALAYILLTAGSVLSWALSNWLYKKPLSKLAFMSAMTSSSGLSK